MRLDRGRAFLRIMRGFELTEAKQDRLLATGSAERPYPARVVWGEHDPALGLDHMARVQRVLGVDDPVLLPAKHFLQEDQAAPARLRDRRPGRAAGLSARQPRVLDAVERRRGRVVELGRVELDARAAARRAARPRGRVAATASRGRHSSTWPPRSRSAAMKCRW